MYPGRLSNLNPFTCTRYILSSLSHNNYFPGFGERDSMKFFRPPNFFKLFEQFQKLVAFLLYQFLGVDGSWRVTSKLRSSTLIQVARRRSKVFQRFSASLVRVGDIQGVSRRHAVPCEVKKTTMGR